MGLLGDNAGTFASHLQHTYPTLHLDVRAVAKDDAVFDVVVDVGVLHELLFSIESRQASAFVQTICQYASSRVDPRYAHAGFISITPRRKLKGAAYFTQYVLLPTLRTKSASDYPLVRPWAGSLSGSSLRTMRRSCSVAGCGMLLLVYTSSLTEPRRAVKDTSQDYPSIEAITRDISAVYSTHGPLLPGVVEVHSHYFQTVSYNG